MASVFQQVMGRLKKQKVRLPVGVNLEEGRVKIVEAALPKLVLEAFTAGIRPTLSDWLEMPDTEKVLWQRYYEQKENADKAELAAMVGNPPMARRFLNLENPEEQHFEALRAGLDRVTQG